MMFTAGPRRYGGKSLPRPAVANSSIEAAHRPLPAMKAGGVCAVIPRMRSNEAERVTGLATGRPLRCGFPGSFARDPRRVLQAAQFLIIESDRWGAAARRHSSTVVASVCWI